MFSLTKDLGIDLGTIQTRIADSTGVLVDEPTIVAIVISEQKIVALEKQQAALQARLPAEGAEAALTGKIDTLAQRVEALEKKPAPVAAEKPKAAQKEKAATSGKKVHTVQKGETIYGISKKYGMKPDDLRKLNNLGAEDTSSPYSISWDTSAASNASRSAKASLATALFPRCSPSCSTKMPGSAAVSWTSSESLAAPVWRTPFGRCNRTRTKRYARRRSGPSNASGCGPPGLAQTREAAARATARVLRAANARCRARSHRHGTGARHERRHHFRRDR